MADIVETKTPLFALDDAWEQWLRTVLHRCGT